MQCTTSSKSLTEDDPVHDSRDPSERCVGGTLRLRGLAIETATNLHPTRVMHLEPPKPQLIQGASCNWPCIAEQREAVKTRKRRESKSEGTRWLW